MTTVLSRFVLRRFAASAPLQNRSRLPIVVKQTAKAGRGVFATRDIAQGEFLHVEEPVVAHPKLDSISKVCYFCLKAIGQDHSRPLTVKHSSSDGAQGSRSLPIRVAEAQGRDVSLLSQAHGEAAVFCSGICADRAKSFFLIESRGDWSELHRYCREKGLKFPLVARRCACTVAAGAASPDALDVLQPFSLPDGGAPAQWSEERALLTKALKSAGVQSRDLAFLSEEWYAGVVSRIHVNAFAVEMINSASVMDLLETAAASVSGNGNVGTAVYVLVSMYNHDCDPNVHVTWPGNATIEVTARRMIKAGEELRITYVDGSLAYDARQEILRESYGFLCECPRCRDRD